MKTITTLAALLLAAFVFRTSVYSTNKVNGEHFSILNGMTAHDCVQTLGTPKLILPETKDQRLTYLYDLGNDWHFMVYFGNHGYSVDSFGIQPAVSVTVDRPPSSIQPSVVVARP